MTVRQVVRRNTVLEKLGLSKSTLQRRIASGIFPPAFHLGERISVWWVDEVEEWLQLYACNLPPEELRVRVEQMVRRRGNVGQTRED